MPHAYSEGALTVAERLRSQIAKIEIPGFGHLAASIGIASFPMHASSPAELIVAADAALYLAKRRGRNRVAVFDGTGANSEGALLPAGGELQETVEHHM